MNKYLFTDGTTGVQQAESTGELEILIQNSAEPATIRIWIFSTSEWISLANFRKRSVFMSKKEKSNLAAIDVTKVGPPRPKRFHWVKKMAYLVAVAGGAFLVVNFTSIKWETGSPLIATSATPANMPLMNIDSLISEIEFIRGQTVDRSTRTNLRLRNTWPDRIFLQLTADKETSSAGSRYFNLNISIDNTTGFLIDRAVVRLLAWKNQQPVATDSFHFNTISYDKLSSRLVDKRIRADSISVEFMSIRSKAFNFCYSSSLKNEPGTYTDRWFCKD